MNRSHLGVIVMIGFLGCSPDNGAVSLPDVVAPSEASIAQDAEWTPDASVQSDASAWVDADIPIESAISDAAKVPADQSSCDKTQPTLGVCSAGAATTCHPETGQSSTDSCAAEEECVSYPLTLSTWTDGRWETTREFTWASCLKKNRTSCTFGQLPNDAGSNAIWKCEGNTARTRCSYLPGPQLEATSPSKGVFSAQTIVVTEPCQSGLVCFPAVETEAEALCLPPSSKSCHPFADNYCEGDSYVTCQRGVNVEVTKSCGAGKTCRTGCKSHEAKCVVAANQALCDGVTSPRCFDKTSILECGDCMAEVLTCKGNKMTDAGIVGIQGTCEMAGNGAMCIAPGEKICSPDSFAERCDLNVAVRCGSWFLENPDDCAARGQICQLIAGKAGCADAPPATCTPSSDVCSGDGSAIEGCCPESGNIPSEVTRSCSAGHRYTYRCPVTTRCHQLSSVAPFCGP